MAYWKSIRRRFAYLFFHARAAFRSEFTYRAATVLKCLSQWILLVAMMALWRAIYQSNASWGAGEYRYLLGYWMLSLSLSQLYPFGVGKALARMVKTGAIAMTLLKPVRVELQLFSQALGQSFYHLVSTAIPLILFSVCVYRVEFTFSFRDAALACAFFVCVYFFLFALEICIGSLSYYTQNLWGIEKFKSSIISFLSGKLFPIALYPGALRNVLQALPFAAMYYLPVNILLSEPVENVSWLFVTTLAAAVLLLAAYFLVSRHTLKRIIIQGG